MKKLFVFILLITSLQITAQEKVKNNLFSWWNFSTQFSTSKKTSISALYSWRRADFIENWQQSLLRVGFNYQLTNNFSITPGYDWVVSFPYGKQPASIKTTEHRIYEQFLLKQNVWKISLKHRYRLEQRFFEHTNKIKHRFRYRFIVSVPVNKKLTAEAFNELFINYGPNTNHHTFDQNWIYGGFAYKLSKKINLKTGFMHQFIVKSNNINKESNPILQFGIVFKNIKTYTNEKK